MYKKGEYADIHTLWHMDILIIKQDWYTAEAGQQ